MNTLIKRRKANSFSPFENRLMTHWKNTEY